MPLRVFAPYGLAGVVLLTASSATAGPLLIDVHQARFTTSVSTVLPLWQAQPDGFVDFLGYDSITRTRTDSLPTSDHLVASELTEASASASWFSVQAFSEAWDLDDAKATSIAEAALVFSPRVSTLQSIGIDFIEGDYVWFTHGHAELFDVTANIDVWRIARLEGDTSTSSIRFVPTVFDASHTYRLTLLAYAGANLDQSALGVAVSGLETSTRIVASEAPQHLSLIVGASLVLLGRRSGLAHR